MQDFEKLGAFYLGRLKQPEEGLVLYDSKDLVTHAVCVGMTGSGKTGLCTALLEEAAIDGIPAIVIDPKGDLGNLLLQFPDMRPADFAPWVNAGESAEAQAALWREGLAKWGEDGDRIRRMQRSADFAIYTPGSSAGVPISVLKSFAAPPAAVVEDRELFRERVSTAATALLSLAGHGDLEPMKSREHILLSMLLDNAWRLGADLDVAAIIGQVQHPPITRVGVLDLEAFYPAKDRFELAMELNNLLASPGFEAWLEGEPLDVARLLFTSEGKPRISVISIAHLSDADRMFFVTLLLNEVLTWTRMQAGTTSLRAILYMDEIFGYFPPVANPPSKRPLLTLLKQARAFGVGVVLATQNPVDLDYKGLANTGTWFIGRLQTERDRARLIGGLEGAASEGGRGFDRGRMEQILAGLGKRMFLMNNVHENAPAVFESRWALSYLRGPLTRTQIKELTGDRKTSSPVVASAAPNIPPQNAASRPILPPGVPQKFVPVRGGAADIVYQAMLLGAAQIRYLDTKCKVDYLEEKVFLTPIKNDSLPVQWEECFEADVDPSDLEQEPVEEARFAPVPAPAAKDKSYTGWNRDLVNWIYGHKQLQIFRSPSLKLASTAGESEPDFRVRLQQAGREDRDLEIAKVRQKYAPKFSVLQDRLRRAQQAVEREQQQAQSQRMQSAISIGSTLLGAFFGRKVVSKATVGAVAGAARTMSRTQKESGDVARAQETVEVVQQQIADLESEFQAGTAALQTRIDPLNETLETVSVKPKKTNISVRLFTLAWAPYRNGQPAWE